VSGDDAALDDDGLSTASRADKFALAHVGHIGEAIRHAYAQNGWFAG
jgi:hypothetical protein